MINKLYEEIKTYIKENYKSLIFLLIIYIVLLWPVDYYILTGGGIMPIGNRIIVEDGYKEKGSFNLSYVRQIRGNVATYTLSYIMPSFERVKASQYTLDEEDITDADFRGVVDLLQSQEYAVKNAYQEAGKKYVVTGTKLYVYALITKNNNFQVGDQIIRLDNKEVNSVEEAQTIIREHKNNDIIDAEIRRNNKLKTIKVPLYNEDNHTQAGIYIMAINTYNTDPKITIKFKKRESGSSGGLAETLDIYNKLVKEDITKGRIIAATGEIDAEGNISEIGGIKHKLHGAVKGKADIFLVPKGANYKECIKIKKKENLKIKIIGVKTFSEAVAKLKS